MQINSFKSGFPFLFTVMLIAVLLSCAQKQDVTGKWQEVGKKSTIEFHRDSTFNAVDDMGMAVSGKYILEENGTIRFEIAHKGSAPEIVEGKLSERGDELTFSSADDKKVETYKRVNR
jgi:hypothetical protein